MDPLAALSVAASVVQFVDYGTEVLSKGYEIYKSADGVLAENLKLQEASKRLQCLTDPLQTLQSNDALKHICTRCVEVSKELNARLDKLKVPDGCEHKAWASLRKSLKSIWGRSKMEELKQKLGALAQELDTHVLFGLR